MIASAIVVAIILQTAGAALTNLPDGVCRCTLTAATKPCYMLDTIHGPVEDIPTGTDGLRCFEKPCDPRYECSDAGTTYCIQKTVKSSLQARIAGYKSYCVLTRPKQKYTLVPYADIPLENIVSPTSFMFVVAGSQDCMIFRGSSRLGDFQGAENVHRWMDLPVDNCSPVKMICTDTASVEGPKVAGLFEADGKYYGTGMKYDVIYGSNNEIGDFLSPDFGIEEAQKANWTSETDMQNDAVKTEKYFNDYPLWRKAFEGKAVPLSMPARPYGKGQGTAFFIFRPPYCNPPGQ